MDRRDDPPPFRHSSDLPGLKALAFEAIRRAGAEGARPSEIARACLGAARVPGPVAAALVESLLAGDRRVERSAEGRYAFRAARRGAEGTPLVKAVFCVTDVETTGVTSAARIIEIGAVRVEGLRLGAEFQTLVNVDVPIPPEIEELTGITEAMLVGAPGPEAALDRYGAFLGDAVFCAHNAPFDRRFVFGETGHFCLREIRNPVLCTRLVARRAVPEAKSFSLDALAERFSLVNEMRHRALGDARVAAEILLVGLDRLMERGVETLEDLLEVQKKAAYLKFLDREGAD